MGAASMTHEEREAFLADVHVGVLSVEDPGRGPLAMPVWYLYEAGAVVISTEDRTRKAGLLRAAGRATLTVQVETPPYKYLSVEGPVTVEPTDRDWLALATRYLGPEIGASYADSNPSMADSLLVRITPEHWRTMDFAKLPGAGGTTAGN